MRTLLLLVIPLTACAGSREPYPERLDWLAGAAVPAPRTEEGVSIPLDLVSLLELAGSRPLAVETARARADAAQARADEASYQWLPSVNPRFRFNHFDGFDMRTDGSFIDVRKQNAYAGAGIEFRLDPGSAVFETAAEAQRARAARLGIRLELHLQTDRAIALWYDLIQAEVSLQVAAETKAHAEGLVEVQEARARVGASLEADVLRARAFAASVDGQVARFEALARAHAAELRALLLLPDDWQLMAIDDALAPIEFPEADLGLPQLLERALAHRPDLQQADALAAAADADLNYADYVWLIPELSAGAAYGGFGFNPSEFEDQAVYFVGIEWDWSFGVLARQQERAAQSRIAHLSAAQLRNRIRSQLAGARARLDSARARIVAARREVEASQAAVKLVEAHHSSGDALIVELLAAQRAHAEARINLVRAICNHNRTQFELRRLAGGTR